MVHVIFGCSCSANETYNLTIECFGVNSFLSGCKKGFGLEGLDADGADFEFGGVGDGVVAGASEEVDGGIAKAEAGKDGAWGGAVGNFGLDADLPASTGELAPLTVGEVPLDGVLGMDFEGFFGKQIVDALGAAGLGSSVVSRKAAAGSEPDGEFGGDGFGGVAVADDSKEAASVFEPAFVEDGGAGMVFMGNGPMVEALFDSLPVETGVDGGNAAKFVEDFLRGAKIKSVDVEAPGDLAEDPPVGFGLAGRGDGCAEALDASFGVGADAVGFGPSGCGEDDVGKGGGFGGEDVDDDKVVEGAESVFAVGSVGVGEEGVFAVDEHGFDGLAALVEGGDFGDAFFGVDRAAVEFLKFGLGGGVGDGLEAGIV